MGKSMRRDNQVTHPQGHPGSKDPTVVMARDQFADLDDPTRMAKHLPDDTVCSSCDAVVRAQRWTLDRSHAALLREAGATHEVVCPACRAAAEQLPRGIVTLRGSYWSAHRDEILNLIWNEAKAGAGKNLMERIIATQEADGCLVVETTNEKLAQRLGRSLARAHDGTLEYEWPDRNHLVRVEWSRDL